MCCPIAAPENVPAIWKKASIYAVFSWPGSQVGQPGQLKTKYFYIIFFYMYFTFYLPQLPQIERK